MNQLCTIFLLLLASTNCIGNKCYKPCDLVFEPVCGANSVRNVTFNDMCDFKNKVRCDPGFKDFKIIDSDGACRPEDE